MAMTKAEKEIFNRLLTFSALRSTTEVIPDVSAVGASFDRLVVGYLPIAWMSDSARVEMACSSSVSHGIGSQTKTSSQNPMNLYSTRILALRSLRFYVEQDCAKRLRRIDLMIENEIIGE